jgi:hypothetical protein
VWHDREKNKLWRNPLNNYDALGGSAPAAMASPDCDCAVLLVRNRGEISRSGNAGVSQCAPAPNGGQGWRKEGDHHLKRGFLQINFFYFEWNGTIQRFFIVRFVSIFFR